MKVLAWIVGVPVGLFILLLLIGSLNNGGGGTITESQKFGNAAEECWKTQGRKSLNPSEKASVASFCEGLEKRAAESR